MYISRLLIIKTILRPDHLPPGFAHPTLIQAPVFSSPVTSDPDSSIKKSKENSDEPRTDYDWEWPITTLSEFPPAHTAEISHHLSKIRAYKAKQQRIVQRFHRHCRCKNYGWWCPGQKDKRKKIKSGKTSRVEKVRYWKSPGPSPLKWEVGIDEDRGCESLSSPNPSSNVKSIRTMICVRPAAYFPIVCLGESEW